MREQDKIDEAAFFLNEMEQREDDPRAYRYMTSAFLSAARSVLQYALEEAAPLDARHRPTNLVGKAWYDRQIKASRLLGYFRNKRDANVHQEPVEPTPTRSVRHEMPWLDDENEWMLPPTILSERVTYHYSFHDWPGPNVVPTLCRQYLDELRAVVADGQAKGFLTPP